MSEAKLRKFQKRMKAVPVAVRRAVAPSVLKGAQEIADLAETLAPEDTGDLKNSITVTGPGRTTPEYSQPGGSMTMGVHQAAVTVGSSDVRYPHLVEHGTREVPAQPFLWPAYRLLKKRTANRIKRAVGKAVREAR